MSSSPSPGITGATFTDSYPANLVNATPASGATTCAGGTVTAANGGASVALSGATIPASGSCTVTVNVTSGTAATYNNSVAIGALTYKSIASIIATKLDRTIPPATEPQAVGTHPNLRGSDYFH